MHMKEELFVSWAATEETTRAERWREEGRREIVTEKRALAAALAAAEATAEALRATVDRKVEERVADRIAIVRAECETDKMREMLVLRERIATAEGKDKYIESLEGNVSLLRDKHATLEARYAELNTQLLEVTTSNTKSSHAIGKAGEAEVYDMLMNTVCPAFQFATVKDMSQINHSADFHLTVMGEDGSKIKILVDSKKYNKPVSTVECLKLHADVDADDEARAGLLVSLQTHIQTAKTFQIRRTEKNRPVMYLTFQNTDESQRGEILCWAVRVLQAIAVEKNFNDRQHMIDRIEIFLNSFNSEIKDMDVTIRSLMKNVDAMKVIRNNIVGKITKFRTMDEIEEDTSQDVIEHIINEPIDTQCNAIKSDGKRCLNRRFGDGDTCKIHKK